MAETLLGHLAVKFGSHPENWATEALGYILRRSTPARETVRDLLGELGIAIPVSLAYRNQAAGDDDEGQPDLVGCDDEGTQRLIIEAKFGAGLTKHQPVTYLDRLTKTGDAVVFVVPGERLRYVWAELLRRGSAADLGPKESTSSLSSARVATTTNGRLLACVTWRGLLGPIVLRLDALDERATREDVAQLLGLCDRMDAQVFLPVAAEELTSAAFRRVFEFGEIAEEASKALVGGGIADPGRVSKKRDNGVYGRHLSFRGVGALLACDVRKWMKYAATPLWLTVYGPSWGTSPTDARAVRDALASLEMSTPPRMFMSAGGFPTVPLFVHTGAERHEIVEDVADQATHVATLLTPLARKAGAAPAGPPPQEPDDEEPVAS